ncbi:MAG: L,D-transpeptidase [Caldilineaceae bacterium]|nr:L,D-transpeptidase [Caldilineaceae bacterium]
MNRDAWLSAHLLRWQHIFWLSSFAIVVGLWTPQRAFAQSGGTTAPTTTLAVVVSDNRTPILSEHGETPVLGDSQQPNSARVAARPPLPFRAPQIGPLIRTVSMDDIARRTTAFIPQSLDNLTEVAMPDEEKWIRVDLSEQIVVAYEEDRPIRAFVVSTGLPGTPTVTGQFRIRMKVEEQSMVGGEGSMYYNLPGVKWVQYFYEDYGFHGTYWHSNFGQPMSHGCVNMTDADAKWLFDWAGPTWDGETVWYPSSSDNPGTMVIVTP